jgi:hypothetical protein
MTETWTPPDPPKARVEREYAALFRIHQRHADSPARRARPGNSPLVGPTEAVRLLVSLAAGSSVLEDGEEDVDAADVTAALTLMPRVRAEIDELEASLLLIARGQGMTWQELAFWLGLGSAQAARQRYERLALRTAAAAAATDPEAGPEQPLCPTGVLAVRSPRLRPGKRRPRSNGGKPKRDASAPSTPPGKARSRRQFLWRRLFVRRARILYVLRKVFAFMG